MTPQLLFRIVMSATLVFAGKFASAQEAFDRPTKQVDSKIDLKADAAPENNELETLFERDEQDPPSKPITSPSADVKSSDIKELKDLERLSELKDVAVIQRRYLPKTKRWELFGAPAMVVNDPFFQSYGLNARLAYYFSERYGIELTSLLLSTSQRTVTSDLHDRHVETTSLLQLRNYFGADFKWTPVYGKMTFVNRTITPFDLYFSAGLGTTGTSQGSAPTLHLGTGQTFALSKSTAVRWDFSWNFYSAASNVAPTAGETRGTQIYNNLLLMAGFSWFFPEATYR